MGLVRKLRQRGVDGLLVLVLCWPAFHLIGSLTFGFSPWRFFGWGMYATPHPESLSRLDLVFSASPASPLPPIGSATPAPDESCLHVWREDQELPIESLCDDPVVQEQAARVLHYRSANSVETLIKTVESAAKIESPHTARLIVTHQRFSIRRSRASLQQKIFLVPRP